MIIELPISNKDIGQEQKEKLLAEYFANMEINDFIDLVNTFEEVCGNTYLYKDINMQKFSEEVKNHILNQYYDHDMNLKDEAVKEINNFYGKRVDLDEYYEKINNNKD